MKLSAYNKENGHDVSLLHNYNDIHDYDQVYLSKVFDFTKIPIDINEYQNIIIGGTGFYWTQAPDLPYEVEHHMPDYNLYDGFIKKEVERGINLKKYKDYIDYSIGFTSRGCFRKCSFCVNQKYNNAFRHSPVNEFLNKDRKNIYLWDDNFLACAEWRQILDELKATNKPFQFRQGLDIRLINNEKAKLLSNVKYHGDYIFAFDNIEDKELIINKLKVWKKYTNKTTKLYVFCGFNKDQKYNMDFWKQDIINTFERIKVLMEFGCLPYIMRHVDYEKSPYRGMYINLARWCNQPSFFKKKSFREYCEANGDNSSTMRYLRSFEKEYPEIAKQYYNLRFEKLNIYKN